MDTAPTITVKEAAAFWGVSVSTIQTWIWRYRIENVGYVWGKGMPKTYRFADLARAERIARNQRGGRKRTRLLKFDWQS